MFADVKEIGNVKYGILDPKHVVKCWDVWNKKQNEQGYLARRKGQSYRKRLLDLVEPIATAL